jgi:hypothetical protein
MRLWCPVVVIAFFTASILLGGCTGSGYRTYGSAESLPQSTDSDEIDTIVFYFSSLDSIKPYKHRYPTGAITAPAPNLDPREFMLPDTLVHEYTESSLRTSGGNGEFRLAIPDRKFEILGEVFVEVTYSRTSGLTRLKNHPPAPNLKPWVHLAALNWNSTFEALRKSAGRIGADAVIEIFCATGINSILIPSTPYRIPGVSIPLYGANDRIIREYIPRANYATDPRISTSGWVLMGLAVCWK